MYAVPHDPGVVGTALLITGTLLALAFALFFWYRATSIIRPGRWSSRAAVAITALALACGLAVAPWNSWRLVEDLRASASLENEVAEQIAVYGNDIDGRIFDALEQRIPSDESFYVVATPELENASSPIVFELWPLTALLPRHAVDNPAKADWIVSWGVDPTSLGVSVTEVEVIANRRNDQPPVYLARVNLGT